MLLLSIRAILHFSPLQMFQRFTCTNSGILSTSMTVPIDFDELPTDEDIMSFFRELGHTGEIKSITDVVVDQMHQPWRTFATLINRSLSGKTTGLDKLCLSRAQILWAMYYKKNVDYVELLWEDFIYQINNKDHKKQDKMYYPRFTKVIIHYFLTKDKTISRRNKTGMHTSRDDYLINTLRFVSTKETTQIYGAILPDSMTSPEMRETKAYKTYLGYATGVPTKKTTRKQSLGVVLRDTPEVSSSMKKGKVTIDQDFHMTHPSGSGAIKIKPSVTNEGTGAKPGVPNVIEEESTKSKDESWGNDENDCNNDHDSSGEGSDQENDRDDDNTQSDNEKESDSKHETDENETKSKFEDNPKGDEDEVIDYTTSMLYDDVGVTLNDPVYADDGSGQKEGADAEMTNAQQGNENLKITFNQIFPLQMHTLFLQWMFLFIMKVSTLEKEVSELRKDDPLNTQVTALVDEHLDSRLGATREEFMNYLSASITARITEQVKI
ncbi:hypothetical protein Tco_0328843 [Tanacetum coccineum]